MKRLQQAPQTPGARRYNNPGVQKTQEVVPKLEERKAYYLSCEYAPERSTERPHQTPENPGKDIGKNGEAKITTVAWLQGVPTAASNLHNQQLKQMQEGCTVIYLVFLALWEF